jgi:cytokinin dehydrogenase
VCGQAQVLDGIVIDSSTMNGVRWQGEDQVDAQPGAQWDSVARTALQRSRTPPVMPDALMLTVGGTLSAGGTGETSCRFGAQVDHVVELDVVTGRGELLTCSPTSNDELFHMILAGLGQCGIIVRARLKLVDAPKYVLRRTSPYSDSDALVGEAARVANAGTVPVIAGEITKDSDGRWRMALVTGTFSDEPGMAYSDYLDRRTASVAATKARGTPNPSLAVVLPERSVRSFLTSVLSDPEAAAGIWRIEVLPMMTANFKQPLHVLPEGALVFTVRLQRRATAKNAPDHRAMVRVNQTLARRCIAAGGKIYPPHAPVLSREEWQRHYGRQTWQRFAAAKKRFDPSNVLTPGAGVFGGGL